MTDGTPARADRLGDLQQGATLDDALALFDGCDPVQVAELVGCWKGSELPTGHPFDGLLEELGWYGKRFDSPDGTHPMVSTMRRVCSA